MMNAPWAPHAMAGTAGADVLRVADLLAFAWRPDPGKAAARFWDEAGHAVWDGESHAAGRAVFEGVTAALPFAGTPTGFAFRFSTGVEVTGDALLHGGPWRWDPATGTLDPQAASTARWSTENRIFGVTEAYEQTVPDLDLFYVQGVAERGGWVPLEEPFAVVVRAGDGADTVLGGGAADTLMGEAGDDLLRGGAGADRLLGGDGADAIEGGAGNDTIDGQRGDDLIRCGAGADVASGGSGRDTVQGGDGRDRLYGFMGDDVLMGGAAEDLLFGGEGFDMAGYQDAPGPMQVNLDWGVAGWLGGPGGFDLLDGIEGVIGTRWADLIDGDAGDNVLEGGGGRDTIAGGAGADRYVLGTGPEGLAREPWDAVSLIAFAPGEGDTIDLRGSGLQRGLQRADVFLEAAEEGGLGLWVRSSAWSKLPLAELTGVSAADLAGEGWLLL